jgi:predicted dehydrogenase/GT2 family glycosyltransferase
VTGTVSGLVSVVMLVRDRPDYTRQALDSLAACEGDMEFVIVDNGSGPATAHVLEAFREHAGHPVELLRFAGDSGGSSRRNAGAAVARGEYLFFVDNDVVADDPALLSVLKAELGGQQRLAAVSPLLRYPGDGDLVQCAGGGSTAGGHIGLVGRGEVLAPRHRAGREQTWAPTAALLVRAASFARAGGFDEAFDPVALCEDVDLCCRMRAAGEEIRFTGAASLRHYEGMTFNHLGHDKLAVWKRHVRVLRARWAREFARGPVHDAGALAWRPVVKDYSDPARPRVRLLGSGEAAPEGTTFFASSATLARPRAVPPVRVGVAGCGQAAVRGALPAFAGPRQRGSPPAAAPFLDFGHVAGVSVTGIADPDLINLMAAARWYQVPHALRDPAVLLDTVPFEGLVVCTPPQWHTSLALAAVERGLPVLTEKPAALTHAQAAALAAACADGAGVSVNLPWAHHPALAVVAGLVGSGVTGTPRSFTIVFEHGGPQAWSPRASWYLRSGGGVITDLGLHALDAAERILTAPLRGLAPVKTSMAGEVPVRASAEVSAGEVTGTVEVGWDAPAPRFSVTVDGEQACVRAQLIPYRAPGLAVEVRDAAAARLIDVPFTPGYAGPGPYAEFAASLRGGPPPRTSVDKVANALRTMICWAEAATGAGGCPG